MRAALLALVMLAGCASVPAVKTVCPPIRTYSPAEQAALAGELAGLAAGSAIVGAMTDYGALRDAVRACRGASP